MLCGKALYYVVGWFNVCMGGVLCGRSVYCVLGWWTVH